MSKKVIPAGQLSLLDLMVEELADDSEDLTTRGPFSEMPEYYVNSHSWADGDTSPDALESLSYTLLDSSDTFTRDDTREKYNYRAVTTAVIGQKVWVAWKLEKSFKELFGQALGDEDV